MTLDFTNFKDRRYGVSVKYYSSNNEVPTKRIDYEVDVRVEAHENGWQIEIDKQNVFFNQHEPDLISEILSQSITKSIYPIKCVINNKGIPVKGIINHEDIIKRWKSNQAKLKEKYESETTDNFIKLVDVKINNRIILEKSMKYDLFWNLFFHPKFISYGNGASTETDLHLAVVPYKIPLRFRGIQILNEQVTTYNAVQVRFNSEEMEAPKALISSVKMNKQKYFMKLDVVFDLDATHYFPMHTTAKFDLYFEDNEQQIFSEKKIQFSMYQINVDAPVGKLNMVLDDEKPKDKRSKLMKFIDAIVGD
ncbi:hypothetical protein ABIB40_003670 [Pedobacter sp. UYP30]|uniref:hypothetical protein n=1 Tax=Pedobacter sp. UYP30 TaxID=1756400 RepID=UPI00339390D2